MFVNKHNVKIPADIVSEKIEVTIGLHPHLHASNNSIQRDVTVDWDHFWGESSNKNLKIIVS